jgi:hypothetical protein
MRLTLLAPVMAAGDGLVTDRHPNGELDMRTSQADADDLQKHIAGTYFRLRLGMVVLAAALPLALWLGGWFADHAALRCSMSAYYFSPAMRDTFVGVLFAVGMFLYLYKGFSRRESWALNLAGACAVGIAMVPTTPVCGERGRIFHGIFAVLFFLAIAYVCVFRAADTLSLIRDTRKAERLRAVYRWLGAAMVASPLIAVALAYSLHPADRGGSLVFFVETVAVLTFAAYWLAKSLELSATDAEELALERKLHRAPAPPAGVKRAPGRLVQIEPPPDAADDARA